MENQILPKIRSFTDTIKEGTTLGIERPLGRRDFLKIAALSATGILLPNCAHVANVGTLSGYEVYNKPNPNYKGVSRNFYDTMIGGTPGLEFLCDPNTPMYAAVSGLVLEVGDLGPNRGMYVNVLTSSKSPKKESGAWYFVGYGHLGSTEVKERQNVERGQLIGYAFQPYPSMTSKLMMREAIAGVSTMTWVDPDNYGKNHSYIDYWDGSTPLEIRDVEERSRKQESILETLIKLYKKENIQDISRMLHGQSREGPVYWSRMEKFRYLEFLYKKHPEHFAAPKQKMEELIKEFYYNQPIILTLPFKK